MPYRPVPACVVAICFTAVIAGCSSSGDRKAGTLSSGVGVASQLSTTPALSTPDYRNALHQVALEEDSAQHRVQNAFHARTVAQLRSGLAAFATDQRRAADRLEALDAPADAAAANAQLAKAFADNAAAIETMLNMLTGTKTVQQAMASIQKDQAAQQAGREIDAALAKLKRLGYTSGS